MTEDERPLTLDALTKRRLSGDVMAWLYAELGSYVAGARAMRVTASTVHQAVQRRVAG